MDQTAGDKRLDNVTSRDGRAARDHLREAAASRGWHLRCGGTMIPHIQFRAQADERPYPFSLTLNPAVPTFYVRRPSAAERESLVRDFNGAHLNPSGEVKIPVPDRTIAKVIAERFLR